MVTTRAEVTYSAALNRNSLFSSVGLRNDIPRKVLYPDEEVLLAIPGVAGDYPNVLIVTTPRVILAKVVGPITKAKARRWVTRERVTGVRYRPGTFTRIKVQVHNGRAFRMLPNKKDDAARFRDEFEYLIRTGRSPE